MTTAPRLIGVGTALVGVTVLARPGLVCDGVSEGGACPSGWIRLLGARYLAQGLAQVAWPTSTVLRGSAVVDGLHGLSMVPLMAAAPAYRRLASLSAVVAATLMTANALTARRMR